MNKIREKGFTLIELLIVVGIIAILAAAIIIAVSPGEQLGEAQATARQAQMQSIGTAIYNTILDDDSISSVADVANLADCEGTTAGDGNGTVSPACATAIGLPGGDWVVPGTASDNYTFTQTATGDRVEISGGGDTEIF